MAENSAIEWTDHTFNPWSGCTKVAPGCANCYAEVNYSVKARGVKWGPSGNRVRASDAMWRQPLKWKRQAERELASFNRACQESRSEFDQIEPYHRPRVFCASLADIFEDWDKPIVDHHQRELFTINGGKYFTESNYPECRPATMDDMRRDLFALIDATPHLDWLLLTKRPENVRRMWMQLGFPDAGVPGTLGRRPYLYNVWLGTSISEQETADRNLPHLLACRDLCPALFVSAEPLLGEISAVMPNWSKYPYGQKLAQNERYNWLTGEVTTERGRVFKSSDGETIDWLIIGGESGPKARPCNIAHVRSLVEQCKAADVACFVKQLGSDPREPCGVGFFGRAAYVNLQDPKGADMSEWPADLRVREFPTKTHKEAIHV
ncbi:DUF5131 family protein [Sphingomonas sp.]|uniref:DUF5131 family protein n=1 Tax=Sphingomonas sp. TaxID=28214 RepID=UPI0025D98ABC|nr:DUF5131 family protein [Sphingomonas sp.]